CRWPRGDAAGVTSNGSCSNEPPSPAGAPIAIRFPWDLPTLTRAVGAGAGDQIAWGEHSSQGRPCQLVLRIVRKSATLGNRRQSFPSECRWQPTALLPATA